MHHVQNFVIAGKATTTQGFIQWSKPAIIQWSSVLNILRCVCVCVCERERERERERDKVKFQLPDGFNGICRRMCKCVIAEQKTPSPLLSSLTHPCTPPCPMQLNPPPHPHLHPPTPPSLADSKPNALVANRHLRMF